MAFTHVGNLGTALSTAANQASLVLTTTATAARRSLVVVLIAVDNNQTTDGDATHVSGVTDSVGNTYTLAKEFANGQAAAQAGAEIAIFYSHLNTILPSGGTITATYSPAATADASAMTAKNFAILPNAAIGINGTPGSLANDAANAGSLNVTTSNAEMLRVRGIASESSSTTALTPTATWAIFAQAISGAGTSATEMGVRGEWVINTGTAAASAPTGGAGAVDHASAYVAFQENQVQPSKNDWWQGDWPEKRKLVRDTLRTLSAAVLASSIAILPPQPAPAAPSMGSWRPQFALPVVKLSRVHMRDGIAFKPRGLSVADPPVLESRPWLSRFDEPVRKPSRVHMRDGRARPDQEQTSALTTGAFVSNWAGPVFSRQFQYQSVVRLIGEVTPNPSVTDFTGVWGSKFPGRRPSRESLREGVSFPLGLIVEMAPFEPVGTFVDHWVGPTFSRQFQYQAKVYTPGQTDSAEPEPSSGAFVSPWGGPTFYRPFWYQANVTPPQASPTAAVAPSTGWFSSYSLPARGGYSVVDDIYGFGVPDPFSFAWFHSWAPPTKRKVSYKLYQSTAFTVGQVASDPAPASSGAFVSNWAGPVFGRALLFQSKTEIYRLPDPFVPAPDFGWHQAFKTAPIKRSKPWFLEGVAWDPQSIAAVSISGAFTSTWSGPATARQFQYQSVVKPTELSFVIVDTAPPYGWYVAFDWTERRARTRTRLAQLYPSIAHTLGPQEGVTPPEPEAEHLTGYEHRTTPLGYRMRGRSIRHDLRAKYPPEFWAIIDNTPRDEIERVIEEIETAIAANEAGKVEAAKAAVKAAQAKTHDLSNVSALQASLASVFATNDMAARAHRLELAYTEAIQAQYDIGIQLAQDEEDILNILLADDDDD